MSSSEPRREEGEVVAIQGNRATVKMKATGGCDKCNLCSKVSDTEMVVEAIIQKPVSIGEKVSVTVKPGTIVKAAFILYIFPLFGLIGGYYFGRFFESLMHIGRRGELIPAIFGFLFLIACFIPIKIADRRRNEKNRLNVIIQ